jgi:hypothetical protein
MGGSIVLRNESGLAAAALLADVALKWPLARSWREMIRGAAGW